MKVLLLSDISSEHTEKWALGLAKNGIEVGLFSFNKSTYAWYENKPGITLLYEAEKSLNAENKLSKITYLTFVNKLKAIIKSFKPDVLHAHYATSYGLIGAMTGFHPFIISAWGTDVMKFPQKNVFNRSVLKYNLRKADAICATSNTIKEYLKPVTKKDVYVIPFGVDINVFSKREVKKITDQDAFVIGCIKSLESIYNIDVIIKALAILKRKYPAKKIKLLIIGVGSQEKNLKNLVKQLSLDKEVIFTGRIPFEQVSDYFNMLDVLVNISDYESFGVSVIEAMACCKAVIATNTGGLKEIINSDSVGKLVPVKNIETTCEAIETYMNDMNLMEQTGNEARERVKKDYNWDINVKEMISVYQSLINK